MEPACPIPHLQAFSNYPYPEPNQPILLIDTLSLIFILILPPHLRLGLPKNLFPVGFPFKFLKYSFLLPFWLHDLPILVF